MKKDIFFKKSLAKVDYLVLLFSLLGSISIPAFFYSENGGVIVAQICDLLIVLSGISILFSHKQDQKYIGRTIGYLVAILTCIDMIFSFSGWVQQVVKMLHVGYYFYLTMLMFQLIFKSKTVDQQTLVNAVSGYLLLGTCWSIIVSVVLINYPHSFNFLHGLGRGLIDETYYSFITLSTLGYGDLLPMTPKAKSLAIFISLSGQFYTTIIMGIIVGKFISNKK